MKNFGIGKETDYFIEQLSMLLSAGMPVVTALAAIKKEIKSKRLKQIIDSVSAKIEAGSSIASALDTAEIFPKSTISLIKIGEQSGRLAENLQVVAKEQQKEREFRSKVSSAMMYPLFVFSLTIFVGVGIAWFILPRLATVFEQLRIDLPLITRWLINLGTFLGQYGTIVIPALLAVSLFSLFFLFIYSKTNFLGQIILFAILPISRLLTELELSRFGSLLGNLLQAGLPILDSLESLAQSTSLYRYQKLYVHIHDRIAEGNSFAKSFELYKHTQNLIPIPIQQLIITSEQSGNTSKTLQKIGQMYEAKTETTAKNITILLEPILLVIVWVGVVAVALAVILPLYSLIGNFNSSAPPPAVVVPPPISSSSPTPTPAPINQVRVLDTEVGFLNVRQQPSLTAPVTNKAVPGETYEYLQLEGEWYQISLPNGAGWVFADYVEEIK